MSIRGRLTGRLVGIWSSFLYNRIAVSFRNTEVSVDRILTFPTYFNSILGSLPPFSETAVMTPMS